MLKKLNTLKKLLVTVAASLFTVILFAQSDTKNHDMNSNQTKNGTKVKSDDKNTNHANTATHEKTTKGNSKTNQTVPDKKPVEKIPKDKNEKKMYLVPDSTLKNPR